MDVVGNNAYFYKPDYEGPRPTNTLRISSELPCDQQHLHHPTKPLSRGRKARPITLEEQNGTVTGESQSSAYLEGHPRSSKRRKTYHNLKISPESVLSVEPIDRCDASKIKIVKHDSHGGVSQTFTGVSRKVSPQHIDTAREYRSVELLMNSDSKKRIHMVDNEKPVRTLLAPLLTSSRSKSNELRSVGAEPSDHVPEGFYPGTMKRRPEMPSGGTGSDGKKHKVDENPLTSADDQPVRLHPQSAIPRKAALDMTNRHVLDDSRRIGEAFVSLDGGRGRRRRDAPVEDNLGSDELAGPAENGRRADVVPLSPEKRSHHVPARKISRMAKQAESLKTEPSNIKRTAFSSLDINGEHRRNLNTSGDEFLDGELVWHVPVAAINIPGLQEIYKSPHMELIYDIASGNYLIFEAGEPKTLLDVHLRIEPKKLLRCIYELDGFKMRFEHSKTGHEDNVLDLQLRFEMDVHALLSRFADLPKYMCRSLTSEKMHQMFETRRKARLKALYHERNIEAIPEDVHIALRNQQRRMSQQHPNLRSSRTSYQIAKINNIPDSTDPQKNVKFATNDGESSYSRFFSTAAQLPRRSTRTSSLHEDRGTEKNQVKEMPDNERYSKIHSLGERWEKPVSFPTMGKKKATVEWEDLERLDDGQFLNDNLIGFYLRVLEEELQQRAPELAKRVYFFNTFFYERLTKPRKGLKGINYEGVQKWTRLVDLFTYDYVIVPINESIHWYVAVICNLTALNRTMPSSTAADAPDEERASETLTTEDSSASYAEQRVEPIEIETAQSFAGMSLESREPKECVNSDLETEDSADQIACEEDALLLDSSFEARVAHAVCPADAMQAPKRNDYAECSDQAREGTESEVMTRASSAMKKTKRKSQPPVTKINPDKPVIITFDSLGASHGATVKWLKTYLQEEAKAKRGDMGFDLRAIKGVTARSIPQQTNSTDCGLFMLGYVSKLLAGEPKEFVSKIIRRQYDERRDWPNLNPCEMRVSIREYLQMLHEERQGGLCRVNFRIGGKRSASETSQNQLEAFEHDKKASPDIVTMEQSTDNTHYERLTKTTSTEAPPKLSEKSTDKVPHFQKSEMSTECLPGSTRKASSAHEVIQDDYLDGSTNITSLDVFNERRSDNSTSDLLPYVSPSMEGVPIACASSGDSLEAASGQYDLQSVPHPDVHSELSENIAERGCCKSSPRRLPSEVPDSQQRSDVSRSSTPQRLLPSQQAYQQDSERDPAKEILPLSNAGSRCSKIKDAESKGCEGAEKADDTCRQEMTAIEIDD